LNEPDLLTGFMGTKVNIGQSVGDHPAGDQADENKEIVPDQPPSTPAQGTKDGKLRQKSSNSHLSAFFCGVSAYLKTLSASINIPGGIFSPISPAVLLLTTNSNFRGVSTGRSCGFVPLKMRSTNQAPR
jgi:hypothetical protein